MIAAALPVSCAFMAQLITLLGELPPGRDRRAAERLQAGLDQLEYAARCEGAGQSTLTAIQGARVLLSLSAFPLPLRPLTIRP